MKPAMFLAAFILVAFLGAVATAQCSDGACCARRPVARAVAGAPLQVVAAPARIVGRLFRGIRFRRAVRVQRRAARRRCAAYDDTDRR